MKVEIIHGNEAGTVKDLPQTEAECAIQTGFAKPVYEVPADAAGLPSAEDLDAVAAEEDVKAAIADAPVAEEQN